MTTLHTRFALLTAVLFAAPGAMAQTTNVAINTTGAAAAPTAILDISSTTRGFLMPRMTNAQRSGIPTPIDGTTIYQTDATPGFYFYYAGMWNRIESPNAVWDIRGNVGTNATVNFLGTTDALPLIFKTNALERMRVHETSGNVGIGPSATVPTDRLVVQGAVRIYSTGVTNFSNNAGVIRWNNTAAPNGQFHEGNMTGALAGWRKLENDYDEVFGVTYNQAGVATCPVAGATTNGAVIGPPYGNAIVGPFVPTSAPVSGFSPIMPWAGGTATRSRRQYLIRASELNVEQAQWNGNWTATRGLCAGQPVDSFAVYVTAVGSPKNILGLNVIIRHTQLQALPATDFVDLFTPVDPALRCRSYTNRPHPAAVGWQWFGGFSSPFIWNGTDNIIIEICYSSLGTNIIAPTLWATDPVGYNCTYAKYSGSSGACGIALNPNSCGPTVNGCGMDATCSGTVGTGQVRPVFLFSGQIATAPAGTVGGVGKYVVYRGGFLVEDTPNWTTSTTASLPPNNYYAFKGPGRIAAERGVYDGWVRLNDHVFDRYFDGRVRPSDASLFGDRQHLGVDAMMRFMARERHLPTMKGRAAWEREGGFSLGDVSNQLWVTAETQALYLTELHDQLDVLRMLATNEPMSAADLDRMRAAICGMNDLTEAQKDALIRSCQNRVTAGNR